MAKDLFHNKVKIALQKDGWKITHDPYLAVPTDTYQLFLRFEPAKTVIQRYEVRLIIYNPSQEVIEQWIE
jgi:hypothetical protein